MSRRGRPIIPGEPGRRHQISCVVTGAAKLRLAAAAARSGRTLAGEVAHRLDQSFWLEDLIAVRLIKARQLKP